MRKGFLLYVSILFIFIFNQGALAQENSGKKLFLDAYVALSEGRYADAHTLAEKLINDYAGDYQTTLYLVLYVHTFYFLDEDFRQGMLHPTPKGIQTRIEAMKTKSDKAVIDLVKLAWVAKGPGGGFSVDYLNEIVQKFHDSIWADWAEMELGIASIPIKGRSEKEYYTEFYNFGKVFMQRHPNTYLMPKLLCATTHWRLSISEDKDAKDEAIQMCRRVLRDYPTAEYSCAGARLILRRLLGDSCEEVKGFPREEEDYILRGFYCSRPILEEYKEHLREYLQMRQGN